MHNYNQFDAEDEHRLKPNNLHVNSENSHKHYQCQDYRSNLRKLSLGPTFHRHRNLIKNRHKLKNSVLENQFRTESTPTLLKPFEKCFSDQRMHGETDRHYGRAMTKSDHAMRNQENYNCCDDLYRTFPLVKQSFERKMAAAGEVHLKEPVLKQADRGSGEKLNKISCSFVSTAQKGTEGTKPLHDNRSISFPKHFNNFPLFKQTNFEPNKTQCPSFDLCALSSLKFANIADEKCDLVSGVFDCSKNKTSLKYVGGKFIEKYAPKVFLVLQMIVFMILATATWVLIGESSWKYFFPEKENLFFLWLEYIYVNIVTFITNMHMELAKIIL